MADLLRKQIRDAAVAALSGLATTGARVFASRANVLQPEETPGLRISTPSEEIQIASMGVGRIRQHTLDLVVEASVVASSGYADLADQIQQEVWIAIDGDQSLGVGCKYCELVGVEDSFEGELEKKIALKRMTFEVFYESAQGAPDVPL